MKFQKVRPENWNAYLEAHDEFKGLWIFQHVPKTAGSSITAALSAHAAPYTNISADRQISMPIRKQYSELCATVPLERNGKSMRSVSGHLWRSDVDILLSRDPNARLFTFVRDPVRRVISDYRYSRTPAHAQWQEQIAAYPNLDSYIEDSPAVRNKTVFFLTGEREGDASEIIPWIMARFDYIGLLEEMGLSHSILAKLLRFGEAQVEHRRSTEDLPQNTETPTTAQLSRIRKMNELDLALFNRVSAVHSKLQKFIASEILA